MPRTDPLDPRHTAAATLHPPVRVAAAPTLSAAFMGLLRLGYVVRGLIYMLAGVLAWRVALGRTSSDASPTSAIELIGRGPFGGLLLIGIAVGLAGYALWGMIRALFDPLHKGRSPRGLAQRIGYAMSAMAYMGLLVATLRFAIGPLVHMARPLDWTAALIARPAGAWMVGVIGVCWIIGAGLVQMVSGWRGAFETDLAIERMSRSERRWANLLGRFGIVARGAVFAVIGVLMVAAALHAGPRGGAGMGGALLAILAQPFGRTLLAAAAVGLIAFGAFSVMCARWTRLQLATPFSRSGVFHSFVS